MTDPEASNIHRAFAEVYEPAECHPKIECLGSGTPDCVLQFLDLSGFDRSDSQAVVALSLVNVLTSLVSSEFSHGGLGFLDPFPKMNTQLVEINQEFILHRILKIGAKVIDQIWTHDAVDTQPCANNLVQLIGHPGESGFLLIDFRFCHFAFPSWDGSPTRPRREWPGKSRSNMFCIELL
jgi:hypothetical protein